MTYTRPHRFLVLVHPGSLCGSADFNIGRDLADASRDLVVHVLNEHLGPILVIDGGMEDELEEHPHLKKAIEDCLMRSRAGGFRSERMDGPDDVAEDDEHFTALFTPLITTWTSDDPALQGLATDVTGAWYHPDDDGGCVNAVHDMLVTAGFTKVNIDDSAVSIDPEELFDDDSCASYSG